MTSTARVRVFSEVYLFLFHTLVVVGWYWGNQIIVLVNFNPRFTTAMEAGTFEERVLITVAIFGETIAIDNNINMVSLPPGHEFNCDRRSIKADYNISIQIFKYKYTSISHFDSILGNKIVNPSEK